MKKFILSEAHQAVANRARRTIAQVDGLQVTVAHAGIGIKQDGKYYPVNGSFAEDYRTRLWEHIDDPNFTFDSVHFDACFEDEFAFCHKSKLPQMRRPLVRAMYEEGLDVYDEYVNGCKKRGLECFLVHRISGTQLIDPPINEVAPFRAAHPECYLNDWMQMANIESPEIRALKLDMLTECMENYAFDGLEIDFCRHTPFLTPGNQWELRENVTEFMRMLREMTLRIEKEQNRPILLSARISESIENCHIDGLDIEAWAEEKLVDSLTIGSRSFEVDLDSFRKATRGSVKLFPCFDLHHQSDAYHYPDMDIYAGVFSNFWDQSADAITFFNPDTCSYDTYMKTNGNAPLPFGFQAESSHCADAMCLAGKLEAIRAMDKTYVVERRGGFPWGNGRANQNNEKQLPLILEQDGTEHTVILSVGDAVAQRRPANITLSLVLYGLNDTDTISVSLNGTTLYGSIVYDHSDKQINALGEAYISGYLPAHLQVKNVTFALVQLPVDASVVIKGQNYITIAVESKNKEGHSAIELEKVELHVAYAHTVATE